MATQAVLYAHDLDRLSAFYADCIGLTLVETDEGYRHLQADDLVLWLVRGQAPAPKLGPNGSVMRRSEVALKLGFAVESIDRVARTIESFGGRVARQVGSLLVIAAATRSIPRAMSSSCLSRSAVSAAAAFTELSALAERVSTTRETTASSRIRP